MVKNCDLGLENAALGLRPRAVFSRPRTKIRSDWMWCNLHWFCPYVNLSQTTSVESDIMQNKKQYERIKQKLKINLSHNKNFKELIHHDYRYQSPPFPPSPPNPV